MLASMATDAVTDGYLIPAGSCDELFEDDGRPKAHVEALVATLQRLGPEALADAGKRRDAIFMQQGITFEVSGSNGQRRDRPFPLDLVPRVLTASEWTLIKRGLAQRIRALNAFVDDVYHAREIVRAGKVPWSLIVSRPSFARPVHGVRAPGGVYTHVSRLRPRARRRRQLAGARGQRAHALGDLLRAREPAGDDAAGARAVRRSARATGGPLPVAAARGAAGGRAVAGESTRRSCCGHRAR